MKRNQIRRVLCGGAGFLALAAGSAVQAAAPAPQPVAQQPSDSAIPDLVVTAQRREERLQNVPASVTALTARDLSNRQLANVQQLTGAVPNLFVGQGLGDPTDLAIGIRGLAQTTAQSVTDPTIGIYVDGVYWARTSGSNVAFTDMERVEVLKGPQGTLFGRNTIGGAFNITTRKPVDDFEGYASVDLGNYSTRNFTGVINIPIGDTLATRFVLYHAEHGGYGHDVPLDAPLNDEDVTYARASVKWTPNDNWSLLVTGDVMRESGHAQLLKTFYVNPAISYNATLPASNGAPGDHVLNYFNKGGYYDSYSEIDPNINVGTQDVTATIAGKIGAVNVKSITGWRSEDADRPVDLESFPYPVIENPIKPFHYSQISEELQVYGDAFDNRLTWITGLYYFSEHDRMGQDTVLLGAPGGFGSLADTIANNSSSGVFAQVTYEVVPKVRLTGGIRYTHDTRQAIYLDKRLPISGGPTLCGLTWVDGGPGGIQMGQFNQPFGAACVLSSPKRNFNYIPWTAGIDYKPTDNVLLYFKASQGYRSGGFLQSGNGIAPSTANGFTVAQAAAKVILNGFNPESLISYEFGAKLDLLDHRVRLNGAVYHSDYSAIQQSQNAFVTVNGITQPFTLTQNVGNASINGLELEAQAQVGPVQLHGAFGYTDPKYTAGPAKGLPFINYSKYTASVGAQYAVPTSIGRFTANIDYNYQSSILYFVPGGYVAGTPRNPLTWAAATQPGYGLLDGKLALDIEHTGMTVAVWCRNCTGVKYHSRAADFSATPVALISGSLGDPATYGFTATYKF